MSDSGSTVAHASTSVVIQDACYSHQYIRSKDSSAIFERPERLRAVKLGLAAAISRLESHTKTEAIDVADALAAAMSRVGIDDEDKVTSSSNKGMVGQFNFSTGRVGERISVVHSTSAIDILNHAATKWIHGDVDGDVYLENLKRWSRECLENIASGGSEIPEGMGLNQGDLYLCPGSMHAIQGALGTVCETVDSVCSPSADAPRRAFVAIRPPGHHCGEDTPSGFCFVNNVAVAAAHAHLQHSKQRIVIFDIDLHHGNGTQRIVWQINEETYRQSLESEREDEPAVEGILPVDDKEKKPGPKVFYGSIHDILSYPCEDGKPELVQAASTSIHGSHGQYIENIHLETYDSESHFHDKLYPTRYAQLIRRAEEFLESTGGEGEDVLIFISCGMDACEHEYPSMSRHNRKVPVTFYQRFTADAAALADKYAGGRLISVLEGGYSDRALISGSMAHLIGLSFGEETPHDWWSVQNLEDLEQAAKARDILGSTKKRGGQRASLANSKPLEAWIQRTLDIYDKLEPNPNALQIQAPPKVVSAPTDRTLRDRTAPKRITPQTSPVAKSKVAPASKPRVASTTRKKEPHDSVELKKLPKVTLKLGPRPSAESADMG